MRITDIYVFAELEAMDMVGWPSATDSDYTPHDAGNEIIALAEKIKAERAIAAMQER